MSRNVIYWVILWTSLSLPVFSFASDSALNHILGATSPTISPNGSTLVFSYQGDIWSVPIQGGIARRLTVHEQADINPVFSPDGQWIAFSSNRFGNFDVFIMNSQGGEPRRLTDHSHDDFVTSFAPDGKNILFHSTRDFLRSRLYRISISGGEPEVINKEEASEGKMSPDGKYLLETIGYRLLFRQGYHGSANSNIWIRDLERDELTQLTNYDGLDASPLWSPNGDSIYFISDRETGVPNMWKMNRFGGEPSRVTHFDSGFIMDPALDPDAQSIVLIHDFQIVRCFTSGECQPIPIMTAADFRTNPIETLEFNSKSDEMAISSDEMQIAFTFRGELFAVGVDGGDAMQLTETPFRERLPQWSPDSQRLYFLSDRSGVAGLYQVYSDTTEKRLSKARFRKTEEVLLLEDPIEYYMLSPDGNSIVYFVSQQGLYVSDRNGKSRRQLTPDNSCDKPAFSPDSRWLTYSKFSDGWNADIYIQNVSNGESYNISMLPNTESRPFFSSDGKRLIFSGQDDRDNVDVYAVWLTLVDHQKYDDEPPVDKEPGSDQPARKNPDRSSEMKPGEGDRPISSGDRKKDSKTVPPVLIDFDRIERRLKRITESPSRDTVPALSPDGKTFAINSDAMGKWEVYTFDEKGTSLIRLAEMEVSSLIWSKDGSTIFYRSNDGSIGMLKPGDRSIKPIHFKSRIEIDRQGEYKQMYRESWLTLKYYFYDKKMHDVDWDRVYAKYLPLVEHCRSDPEFQFAINLMLGELRASHLGIHKSNDLKGEKTGYIGVRLGRYEEGKGWRVMDVVPDSPADRCESRILAGEYIRAINRLPVTPDVSLAGLLNNTINIMTDFEVYTDDSHPSIRTVTLKPVDYNEYSTLAYRQWVEINRKRVDRLSNGRVGYLHIHSMGRRSLAQFERDLFCRNWNKDALIIDVRNNPGGNIHNELIRYLHGKSFGYFMRRGGVPVPQPLDIWQKPSVCLINENSFSDAEVFPNGYQTLGIGKVIGMPTFGGVIGTGSIDLLDGSRFRVPLDGWFDLDGRNMEFTGAVPDIEVPRHPTELELGQDSQLDRAVQELLSEVD